MSRGDTVNDDTPTTAGPSSQPASATQSTTQSTNVETTRARAEQLQGLLDRAVSGELPADSFIVALQAVGVTPGEAEDYINQFEARLARQGEKSRDGPAAPSIASVGDSNAHRTAEQPGETEQPRQMPPEIVDDLSWGLLSSKINHLRSRYPNWASSSPSREAAALNLLTNLFAHGGSATSQQPSTGIPASVLAGAPHLAQAGDASSNPHLAETWRLRSLYSSEGATNPIIDFAQQQNLEIPLPRSVWKDIILDKLVNFEKLHASMDLGYSHDDESKQLIGDIAIIRKDHVSSKKPVRSQTEWEQVFDAWAAGVKLLFPHRSDELANYRRLMRDYFRTFRDDPVVIRVDLELRDSYDKEHFRLDDRARHHGTILAQAYRGARGRKRSPPLVESTEPAANVVESTVPLTSRAVELRSKLVSRKDQLEVSRRAQLAALAVKPLDMPTATKRKLSSLDDVLPRFRRGFGWSGSVSHPISPAVTFTEHADPLPKPPEHLANRWSPSFPTTLPGMRVSPMFVVWRNDKPRVVTDHSASRLNDGIPRAEAKVRYDNMHDFAEGLRAARSKHPGQPLVVFKSDVASAFLNLPAHPIWQLCQVVRVDGKLHQVQLLILWDTIGCPWEAKKQMSDSPLVIIGFWVDPNLGSISLFPSSVVDILTALSTFINSPNRKQPLREWQRLAGHLNWLLNVLPWGRPAL
ncbi:hypothetical protein CERSUDRAFT_60921, partial [Gelatoporia subvermispora B]